MGVENHDTVRSQSANATLDWSRRFSVGFLSYVHAILYRMIVSRKISLQPARTLLFAVMDVSFSDGKLIYERNTRGC